VEYKYPDDGFIQIGDFVKINSAWLPAAGVIGQKIGGMFKSGEVRRPINNEVDPYFKEISNEIVKMIENVKKIAFNYGHKEHGCLDYYLNNMIDHYLRT